jgi:hypothetical protein
MRFSPEPVSPRLNIRVGHLFARPNELQMTHALAMAALTLMFVAAAGQAKGATIDAKSAELGDVKSAIASAAEGDTVTVPAGIVSWTSTLVITKGITLQGGTSISGSLDSPVVSDKTVILDDIPRPSRRHPSTKPQQGRPQRSAAFPSDTTSLRGERRPASKLNGAAEAKAVHVPAIIIARLKPSQSFRLTGFTFKYGSGAEYANDGGVHLVGTCPTARIDHCHFDQLYANPFIMIRGQIYGVVDHCVLDERPRALTFQIYHDGWGGHTHGDGSWADNAYFGSEKFLFIEDNSFRNAKGYLSVGIDAFGGARYVARHNYLVDTPIGGHGTESSGRFRGVRAIEVYNNTRIWHLVQPRSQLRSGTMLEFNNVWSGNKDSRSKTTHLTCYRQFRPFPLWGGANGNNRLDSNDTHGLYASGKHTGENNSDKLVVAGANWKVNQWVGYSITNTTQTAKTRMGAFRPSSCITANTSDTITFARSDGFGGPNMTFNTGDGYEIYKLLTALDQPGRGKGDLLADKDPVATASWPHQALEPVYSWRNTYSNSLQLDVGSPYPTIQENRDFYNQKTPFDGTAGVGVGKLADRPKTCKPGVAYWATDEGEWDSTHDGADGQLYVCSERDTWSLYYKPYTYPHPLVSATPASSENTAQRHGPANTESPSKK